MPKPKKEAETKKPTKPKFEKFKSSCKDAPMILKKTISEVFDDKEVKHVSYTVMMSDPIARPDQMIELVDLLRNSKEDEKIKMIISTPGGSVITMLDLLDAMDECKSHITTIANGVVASCGFIIWSYGNTIKCRDFAMPMAHASSHGAWGKSADIVDQSKGIVAMVENLLKRAVDKGILTAGDMQQLTTQRKNVWLFKEDLETRLANYNTTDTIIKDETGTNLKKVMTNEFTEDNKKEEVSDVRELSR